MVQQQDGCITVNLAGKSGSHPRQQRLGVEHRSGNEMASGMKPPAEEESEESTRAESQESSREGTKVLALAPELVHAQEQETAGLQADSRLQPPFGRTRLASMFSTPLWQSNLLSSSGREGENIVSRRLLSELKHEVVAAWCECLRSHDRDQEHGIPNDDFYQWQLSTQQAYLDSDGQDVTCAAFLAHSPAFRQLATVMRESAMWFLSDCYGQSMEQAIQSIRGRNLFAFASAQGHDSSHAYHTHHHSIVSGTFYVNVPHGSGAMVAGMGLTSGDNEVILPSDLPTGMSECAVQPVPGNLLIFPSWMPHRVEQSCNKDSPRLSISFNISGEWSELSRLTSWTSV